MPTIKDMGNTLHEIGNWIHQLEEKLAGLGMHVSTSTSTGKRRGRPPGSGNAGKARKRGRNSTLSTDMIALLKSKGPLMPKAIRDTLGAKSTSVSSTLNRLKGLGRVKHSSKGWTAA